MLGAKIERILRLFVKIRGIVSCPGEGIAAHELDALGHPERHRSRKAAVGRACGIREQEDVVEIWIDTPWTKHLASDLLRRRVRHTEARGILSGEQRWRQEVDIERARKFNASHKQVVDAGGDVGSHEVLRTHTGLLAVRRGQLRVWPKD